MIPNDRPEAATQWGVQHNQGIRWEYSEQSAREYIASAIKREDRIQNQAKGKLRLVKRELGPVIEVWNPHVPECESSGTVEES